jgi:hypothetical protein
MNSKAKLFCTLLVGAAIGNPCLGQRRYTVTPVPGPVPTATTYNNATWISDGGTVVFGSVYDSSMKNGEGQPIGQCYISMNGNVQVYSTPGYSCAASGPGGANNSGQFAGVLAGVQLVGSVPAAFSNLNGNFTSLAPQLQADNGLQGSWSTGIDQNGNVVGYAVALDSSVINGAIQYGFLVSGSQTVQLPLDRASSINNFGLIGGDAIVAGVPNGNFGVAGRQPRVAALYSSGSVMQLGTLGGPAVSTDGPESSVTAVNNNGQAVGWSTLVPEDFNNPSSFFDEAFFWDGSSLHAIQMQDAAGNTLASIANSLNDAGEVVGYFYSMPVTGLGTYFSLAGARAFYYSNGHVVDLNTLLVNPPQGLVLATATYINNNGQILASAVMPDGSQPTYLLTPVASSTSPDPERRPQGVRR